MPPTTNNPFHLSVEMPKKSPKPVSSIPFVLPVLFAIPHVWIICDIAIDLPIIWREFTAFNLTVCITSIIVTLTGFVGMLFRAKWGLWITLLVSVCNLGTSIWEWYVTLPTLSGANYPLTALGLTIGIAIYFLIFSSCLLGLWFSRTAKFKI